MSGLSPRHEITINTPQLAPGVTPAFPRTGLIQLPMGPDGTATPGVAITIGSPADARTKLGAAGLQYHRHIRHQTLHHARQLKARLGIELACPGKLHVRDHAEQIFAILLD